MRREGLPGVQVEEFEVLVVFGDTLPPRYPGNVPGENGDVRSLQGFPC